MRKSAVLALALGLIVHAAPALAAKKRGPGKPTPARTAENCKELEGDKLEACKVVGAYLDLWKLQKWADLKKLTHPMTTDEIATAKKNLGEERHAMAPWYWAKDTYLLTDWKLENVEDAALGTVVINTTEKSYRVEEDGIEEGEEASYLVGKKQGKWFVVDRRGGGGGFDATSIKIGKKGFFDEPAEKPATSDAKP
ncbi:hypothetical protein [Vulgatibacter incomptus]|uniref:Lipoprotein n=1 Tax=Vulgatibacter incomptus TaxID=1391653 RepID=A0A0K1PD45_9BACT|nr:hypothetical protein [Vulgatibacter incomptus]AKU91044.1 hypothetical protein AKJ08_1431 [Vulgatibacter incomptus]